MKNSTSGGRRQGAVGQRAPAQTVCAATLGLLLVTGSPAASAGSTEASVNAYFSTTGSVVQVSSTYVLTADGVPTVLLSPGGTQQQASGQTGAAASVAKSVSVNLPSDYGPTGSVVVTPVALDASAAASADLATGTLRAKATTQYTRMSEGPFAGQSQAVTSAGAGAFLYEAFTLSVPKAFVGVPEIGFSMTIDGTLARNADAAGDRLPGAHANLKLTNIVSSLGNLGFAEVDRRYTASTAGDTLEVAGRPLGGSCPADEAFCSYRVFLYATLSTWDDASGRSDVTGGDSVDFGHTARLAFSLPAQVGITSDSGLFLSAVPEPALWQLLAAGLPVLAWARRRSGAAAWGPPRYLRSAAPSMITA